MQFRNHAIIPLLSLVAILMAAGGCEKPLHFPAASMPDAAKGAGAFAAYDTNDDGQADFYTFTNGDGRIDRIGYDHNRDNKVDDIVHLDSIPLDNCRHIVLILDGFGYDVAREFYDKGNLRFCHAPSKVIAPYPTLTDLCMEDLLDYIPCPGFEAKYFDRHKNEIVGGSGAYVRGENEPYNRLLNYRADLIWDAIGYVYPWEVFGKELNDSMRKVRNHETREFIAYYVSLAGVSTRYGKEGQVRALEQIDRFINQAYWQTRGLVKVTLIADHGHTYTRANRIPLESYLAGKGWRLADSLSGPRDVAYIRFGLETYASFYTLSREALAADLIAHQGVEIASYTEDSDIIVLGRDGARARIREKSRRFKYEMLSGDPLIMKGILDKLKPDADGFYDAKDLFDASFEHVYPSPLQRIWRAHFALAQNVPDVIVSLADNYYSGLESFAGSIQMVSTHGGLNRVNSTAFIMTSAGKLPPHMQSLDVPPNMKALTGRDFPMRR